MLSKFSIKQKLISIMMIPLIVVILLSAKQAYIGYTTTSSLNKIEKIAILSTKIGAMVHETQKERGMTAGFLGSKGKKFIKALPEQREKVNVRRDELLNYLKDFEVTNYTQEFQKTLQAGLSQLETVDNIRNQVSSQSIPIGKAIIYYTKMNANFLNVIDSGIRISPNPLLTKKLSAYTNFLLSKERAGIERAVGSNSLAKNQFGKGMRIKFNNLINTQKTYMYTFTKFADTQTLKFYKDTMQGPEIDEVNAIRDVLIKSAKKHQIISKIKELVGYGGIIHNFKNYVIRGNDKYEDKIVRQYNELNSYISQYNSLGNITHEEKTLLNNVKSVFTKYYNGLSNVKEAIASGMPIKQLDKVVKVSDGPAINALNTLSKSLFSVSAEHWFSKITVKINSLKKVENYIADDLIKTTAMEKSKTYNEVLLFGILTVIGIALTLILARTIAFTLLIDVKDVKAGLDDFFAFINFEKDDLNLIDVKSNDELGQMSRIINKNIEATKHNIQTDKDLIKNTIEVANKINNGHLSSRIALHSNNPQLNDLKDIINEMLNTLEFNIKKISDVLISFSNMDYRPNVDKEDLDGTLGRLCDDVNSLSTSFTEILVENKRNGMILSQNANTLTTNLNGLSDAATSQAASLEETAAALEELTTNLQQNTQMTTEMANYGSKVKHSVSAGEKLANKTVNAMEEINEQTSAITDAITVIDQIAFQTNILSLNAAVEAATAGEAGKGFAVVAQEVRNLASRSAEAAKEIKDIVENAQSKTNYGKQIASEMIDGYHELNINSTKTIELIENVTTASKQQEQGIILINDAVNQLDQITQINAKNTSGADEIAKKTESISNIIVKNADEKEFDGKDDIKIRKQTLDVDFADNEKRTVEKKIKSFKKESTSQDADSWDSF